MHTKETKKEIKMKKRNLINTIKKCVAGMVLVCSLLTVFGSVSNEGIMLCEEIAVGDRINI